MNKIIKKAGQTLLPRDFYERLRQKRHRSRFNPKPVDFGQLRKTTPVARDYGWTRGQPVDRYFIEKFLTKNSDVIRGRVLELSDPEYTIRFGGDKVVQSDVLHVVEGNPKATVVGNLEVPDTLSQDTFDCIIFTQALQFIYQFDVALRNLFRALKPGGILLGTFPGISQLSMYDIKRNTPDYWRFTSYAMSRMLGEIFGPENVRVESFGNVLTATSFLLGISHNELTPQELDELDPEFEMLCAARAQKSEV